MVSLNSQSEKQSDTQPNAHEVTLVEAVGVNALVELVHRYHMTLKLVEPDESIPFSYWGEPEAGVRHSTVYVRPDTPVHSFLHEFCHLLCMSEQRRSNLNTDAGGDDNEESAVCYLQICLAEHINGYSRAQIMQDMDVWGYSFRLGATRDWFLSDADDSRQWLIAHGLLDADSRVSFRAHA